MTSRIGAPAIIKPLWRTHDGAMEILTIDPDGRNGVTNPGCTSATTDLHRQFTWDRGGVAGASRFISTKARHHWSMTLGQR
jgi:hypothetical protein